MSSSASGPRFGRYRIRGRIATGGMGEVYKATAQGFDGVEKLVAIKLIRTGLAGEPELVKMFVEEAKVAFLLNHANLVQTFDVGTIDGQYFITMEYVEGRTLLRLLRSCRDALGQLLPQRHAVYVAVEALKGLHYAHRAKDAHGRPLGIVHRDVSPSNILVSREGEVKVSDFGIAWSTMKSHQSELGTIKGKVHYMSPEQVRGGAIDARADVYAIGSVLYEALCGRAPFIGPVGSVIPIVVEGKFPRPRDLNPDVSPELEAIVLRAMALRPEDRFDTAAVMRDELEELALRRTWRLSSTDLASFAEALDEAPAAAAPPADAFDAALGRELCKVAETQDELSVWTSALAPAAAAERASSPAPRASSPAAPPPAETAAAPAPAAPPRTERPTVAEGPIATPPPVGRSRWTLAALYGLAVVVVALGAGLAARRTGPDAPAEARRADPAPPGPAEPAPSELPVGAEPPAWNAAGRADRAPVDAGAADAAAREATPEGDGSRSAGSALAVIAVNTEPWTHVEIDGARVGTTPIVGRRVRAGRHTVKLSNPSRNIVRTLVVTLREGERRRIVLDLAADGP